MGFVGANVTIPHKEAVLALADHVTPTAQRIGAANTLTFGQDGQLQADNTDGYGFITNLKQGAPRWNPAHGPALVLGAGGAARAVIVALQDAGVPQIFLTNRTAARATALAQEFGVTALPWDDRHAALRDVVCVVNTTSLGMTDQPSLALDLGNLSAGALVTDIVYTPLETELLAAARHKGCTVVDGLGMLLHQAVPGFARWFGVKPDVSADLRAAVLGA
jgi:shikimate dehydrogenase